MHKAIMEIAELVEELAEAKRKLDDFQSKADMDKERALNDLKKEIAQALTESDIKREVAIARLESYERNVNKDDFNKEIRSMLTLAITGLSSKAPQGGGKQQQQEQK